MIRKKIRVLLACLCFTALCLLFADTSGLAAGPLVFLAKIQLVPAILAGSFFAVGGIVAATLLYGRVYCAVLCPLGVTQDIITRLHRARPYTHTPARNGLRLTFLALFVAAFVLGLPLIFGLLEPYSAFGRIAAGILAPVWAIGSNVLAWIAERMDSVAVGYTPVWHKGAASLAAALITLVCVGILAWRSGRAWCNTLCPVGTLLGFMSRLAVIRPRLNKDACVHCGLCERGCKARCINAAQADLDASRCVACCNCLTVCRAGAISYGLPAARPRPAPPRIAGADTARRAMLGAALGLAGLPLTAMAQEKEQEKRSEADIPALIRKTRPPRALPVLPPGAEGVDAFRARCTGCQLCVAACPHQVLRATDSGIGALQASMSFERGYCRVTCVACSAVCPTGAIRPITPAEKSAIQIGRAVVFPDACIITTDGNRCTACARACPTGAISLGAPLADTVTTPKNDHKRPAVNAERCTGCGACEYVCPARPVAAIRIEGNLRHRKI